MHCTPLLYLFPSNGQITPLAGVFRSAVDGYLSCCIPAQQRRGYICIRVHVTQSLSLSHRLPPIRVAPTLLFVRTRCHVSHGPLSALMASNAVGMAKATLGTPSRTSSRRRDRFSHGLASAINASGLGLRMASQSIWMFRGSGSVRRHPAAAMRPERTTYPHAALPRLRGPKLTQ